MQGFCVVGPQDYKVADGRFSLIREPRYNYEQQERIDPHRIEMASAAMAHFGLVENLSGGWEVSTLVIIATLRRL